MAMCSDAKLVIAAGLLVGSRLLHWREASPNRAVREQVGIGPPRLWERTDSTYATATPAPRTAYPFR